MSRQRPKPPRRKTLLRKRVFERDGGFCAICRRFDPHWEGDHIHALWRGGPDDIDNIQTLCRRCHKDKTVADVPVRAKTDRLRERHDLTRQRKAIR